MLKKIIKYILSFDLIFWLFLIMIVFSYISSKPGNENSEFGFFGLLFGLFFIIRVPFILNEFISNKSKKASWLLTLLVSIILLLIQIFLSSNSIFDFILFPLLSLFLSCVLFLFFPIFNFIVLWLSKKIHWEETKKTLTYKKRLIIFITVFIILILIFFW